MAYPIVGTLDIGECITTFTLSEHTTEVWQTKIDFSELELILTVQLYMRYKHDLLIGKPSAEHVLFMIGSVVPLEQERVMPVKGRNLKSGLPARLEISSIQVREELRSPVCQLTNVLIWALNKPILDATRDRQIPDQFRKALLNSQVEMTGKLSHLNGLTRHLQDETGYEFKLA